MLFAAKMTSGESFIFIPSFFPSSCVRKVLRETTIEASVFFGSKYETRPSLSFGRHRRTKGCFKLVTDFEIRARTWFSSLPWLDKSTITESVNLQSHVLISCHMANYEFALNKKMPSHRRFFSVPKITWHLNSLDFSSLDPTGHMLGYFSRLRKDKRRKSNHFRNLSNQF